MSAGQRVTAPVTERRAIAGRHRWRHRAIGAMAGAVVMATAACVGDAPSPTTAAPAPAPVSSPAPVTSGATRTPPSSAIPEATTSTTIPELTGRRVLLYGDSLAWEAQDSFRAALADTGIGEVLTETFGGTALCDWLSQMRSDQRQLHPDAVVVEFSGNAFTPCMKGPNGAPLSGDALIDRYADDARTVLQIFGPDATLVYFASAPISFRAEQTGDSAPRRLHDAYASVAAFSGWWARFIDAGSAVEDRGHWTSTLPCLPDEPCDGGLASSGQAVNVVRAPDGIHFCPGAPGAVDGVTGTCPVWSSGAHRYGIAMAAPIPRDLVSASDELRARAQP